MEDEENASSPLGAAADKKPTPLQGIELKELAWAWWHALSPGERAVMKLRLKGMSPDDIARMVVSGGRDELPAIDQAMSPADIAELLELPEGTVGRQLSLAQQKLRQCIEGR